MSFHLRPTTLASSTDTSRKRSAACASSCTEVTP